jgi:hypothetical protein
MKENCIATAQVTITQPEIAVSVSGIATNATCFGEADGSIAVTNSQGATVVTQMLITMWLLRDLLLEHIPTATAYGGNEGQTVLLPLK